MTETSFEAAAVAYIEHHPYAADEDHEIRVVVREVSSGHEHCFKIDLETGERRRAAADRRPPRTPRPSSLSDLAEVSA